jgi:hypothetical protein
MDVATQTQNNLYRLARRLFEEEAMRTVALLLLACAGAFCACQGAGSESGSTSGPAVHRGVENETFLGKPHWKTQTQIYVEKWMQDGGGFAEVPAPEGQTYLVFVFDTPSQPVEPFDYTSDDYGLQLEGESEEMKPDGATVTQQPGTDYAEKGPCFKRDVYMSHYHALEGTFFNLAFLVPADSHNGVLRVKDVSNSVAW